MLTELPPAIYKGLTPFARTVEETRDASILGVLITEKITNINTENKDNFTKVLNRFYLYKYININKKTT